MLAVAASEPTCSVNISLPGNAVHESDLVEISCSIDYRGSWMPVVNCTPELPGQPVVKDTSSSRRVSYRRVMAAADIGDWAVISCDTRFVYREWSTTTASQQINRLMDTPQYHHIWRSSPIRVFNTTGNTRFILQVGSPRCTVRCQHSAAVFMAKFLHEY